MILSVIIPTYHRNDLLIMCLELLAPSYQSIDSNNYEVIVTDDSPSFMANQLSKNFPWARFIQGAKRGPAANRNNGANNAKGGWLIFIDDDCLPSKDLLLAYYNEIEKGKYSAIEGLIGVERPRNRFDEEAPVNLKGGCFWSCNIAVEKTLYGKLKGFDEGFPYPAMEDVDFYERLKTLADVTFLKSAKVIHPWRIAKPFKNFKLRIISNKYMLDKHNVKRDLSYRFKRIKLFIGLTMYDFKSLKRYSFRGKGLFFERICFQFIMLFV